MASRRACSLPAIGGARGVIQGTDALRKQLSRERRRRGRAEEEAEQLRLVVGPGPAPPEEKLTSQALNRHQALIPKGSAEARGHGGAEAQEVLQWKRLVKQSEKRQGSGSAVGGGGGPGAGAAVKVTDAALSPREALRQLRVANEVREVALREGRGTLQFGPCIAA